MARFYAKFDSGSSGWVGALDTLNSAGCFDRLRVSTTSASAALLRNGLIASRSALSADVYADLDDANQNGGLGIYFPPDSGPRSSDNSTFVSWSNAYTASATTTQGIISPADYRTRPTASILSTQTALVGPANPTDSIGVSYNTFLSASNAVTTVVNTFQNGAGVATTPYTRQGTNPSRTLHSLWHDENLQYFAWDDFTPGNITALFTVNNSVVSGSALEVIPGGTPINTNVTFVYTLNTYEFLNDVNPTATFGFRINILTSLGDNVVSLIQTGSSNGGLWTLGTSTGAQSGPTNPRQGGASSWNWNTSQVEWSVGLVTGSYQFNAQFTIYDPTIPQHSSTTNTTTFVSTGNNLFDVKDGNPI